MPCNTNRALIDNFVGAGEPLHTKRRSEFEHSPPIWPKVCPPNLNALFWLVAAAIAAQGGVTAAALFIEGWARRDPPATKILA